MLNLEDIVKSDTYLSKYAKSESKKEYKIMLKSLTVEQIEFWYNTRREDCNDEGWYAGSCDNFKIHFEMPENLKAYHRNVWGERYIRCERGFYNRIHFGDGIPGSMRGLGIGYRIYKSFVKLLGWASSADNASPESQYIWFLLCQDPDHEVILVKNRVMVVRKDLNEKKKISIISDFLNNIGKYLSEDGHDDGTVLVDENLRKLRGLRLNRMVGGEVMNRLNRILYKRGVGIRRIGDKFDIGDIIVYKSNDKYTRTDVYTIMLENEDRPTSGIKSVTRKNLKGRRSVIKCNNEKWNSYKERGYYPGKMCLFNSTYGWKWMWIKSVVIQGDDLVYRIGNATEYNTLDVNFGNWMMPCDKVISVSDMVVGMNVLCTMDDYISYNYVVDDINDEYVSIICKNKESVLDSRRIKKDSTLKFLDITGMDIINELQKFSNDAHAKGVPSLRTNGSWRW